MNQGYQNQDTKIFLFQTLFVSGFEMLMSMLVDRPVKYRTFLRCYDIDLPDIDLRDTGLL